MPIYGLRPRPLGPAICHRSEESLKKGDHVLVSVDSGVVMAEVVFGPLVPLPGSEEADLPAIIRKATAEDMSVFAANQKLAKEARAFCRERVQARRLDMKLVDVEIFFDRAKFIFYFTAPSRIDFRDLVKDLVREYRARIELRQIGARHEAQLAGALGNCGQVCCCRNHLRKFAPVAIRMAKEQNLFLNPAKISGVCGRLLCCLSYEQDNYEKFHRQSPKPGRRYQTASGLLKVLRVNMFKNTVTALSEDNKECEYGLEEWQALKPWHSASQNEPEDIDNGWDEGDENFYKNYD